MMASQYRQKVYLFLHLIVFILILSPAANQQVLAQDSFPSDDEVNRVASQLFCPVCENMTLDVCPLDACRQWRDLIRQQLAEGWTEDEIKSYFIAQYGDRVLGEPPRQGLNWLLYILPPLVILIGLMATVQKLKRQPNDSLENKDPYLERVERDLRAQ